jgi:hypothetical protein
MKCRNIKAIVFTVLLLASFNHAFAQERSQDRDNPTLFDGKGITDKLDGSGDEYFYQFTVGQGKLSIVFKVTASGQNAGATLDLYEASSSRPILSNVLAQGLNGGTEKVSKEISLEQKRNVILMRIKGMHYGDNGGTGTYVVSIEGNAPPPEVKKPLEAIPTQRFDGELDGTDSAQTHAFSVKGPGKVTLNFDVKASGTNVGAYFSVLDSKGKPMLSDVLLQAIDSGSERITKTIHFVKEQVFTIQVKGIRYGSSGGRGIYTVKVEGNLGK